MYFVIVLIFFLFLYSVSVFCLSSIFLAQALSTDCIVQINEVPPPLLLQALSSTFHIVSLQIENFSCHHLNLYDPVWTHLNPSKPTFLCPYNPLWINTNPSEPIRIHMRLFKPIWTHLSPSKPIWTHTWAYMNSSKPIWAHLNFSQPSWSHPNPSEPIWAHPSPSEPIWTHPNPSWPLFHKKCGMYLVFPSWFSVALYS